jgi:hypothetical protein
MADLVIFVRGISPLEGTDIAWQCEGRTSDMTNQDASFFFDSTPIPPGSSAATMNRAIRAAGVAAATRAGRTVDVLDKKIIYGSTVEITAV